MSNELNVVNVGIELDLEWDRGIFSREKLHGILTKEIKNYLKELGVECKTERLAELGGGPSFNFLEALKWAWENKEHFITTFSLVLQIPSLLLGLFSVKPNQRPRITLILSIRSDEKTNEYDETWSAYDLDRRLCSLKFLADTLCSWLYTKYPVFVFDQYISASLAALSFRVRYVIPHEYQTQFNKWRMIRLIRSLRVRKGLENKYIFENKLLITRIDSEVHYVGGGSWSGNPKTYNYYLFFSSKLLKDYIIDGWQAAAERELNTTA